MAPFKRLRRRVGRWAVTTMLRDYRDTWSVRTGRERTADYSRAVLWFYAVPAVVAGLALWAQVPITNPAPLLAALAVFTALLFGLLVLVFNTAVTLRKDHASLPNAHDLGTTVRDLRASVTYSIAVAMVLVVLLAIATATMMPVDVAVPHATTTPQISAPAAPAPATTSVSALASGWTPILVFLATHLFLNVAKILQRFRTAFRYISS